MKINKKKIELYNAFRDGERNEVRKYIIKKMEEVGIYIGCNKKFTSEYNKRVKQVENMDNKYKLNEEERKIWQEEVINEKTKEK
jgi:hypothetical protein